MLKSIVFSLATAFFALQAAAQITETGTDTGAVGQQKVSAGDQSADTAGVPATSPVKTAAPHIETIKEPPVIESGPTPSTPAEHAPNNVSNSSLLAEGIAQKSTGAALVCVGGVFLGGAILYTILFLTDQTTYGICLSSTSSSSSDYYYYEAYYLNPGIFAIPIGAPCMAVGIIKLLKGKHKIQAAEGKNSFAPVTISPYLAFQPTGHGMRAGLTAFF